MMWTEFSWAFPESYIHCRWQLDCALERWRTWGDKRAHNEGCFFQRRGESLCLL